MLENGNTRDMRVYSILNNISSFGPRAALSVASNEAPILAVSSQSYPAQTSLDRRTVSVPIVQTPGPQKLLPSTNLIDSTTYAHPSSRPLHAAHQERSALQHHALYFGTQGPNSRAVSDCAVESVSTPRQTPASGLIQPLTINMPGGNYRLPVDVHKVSKLSDEKRARNAVASLRFRQRRKEREKDATTTIEKMRHQIRELERRIREVEQERDFYRSERDCMEHVLQTCKATS